MPLLVVIFDVYHTSLILILAHPDPGPSVMRLRTQVLAEGEPGEGLYGGGDAPEMYCRGCVLIGCLSGHVCGLSVWPTSLVE